MKILITGANRGLGFSLARLLVGNGHTVLAGVRKTGERSRLEQLAGEYPDRVRIMYMDVADESSVAGAADTAGREFGAVDVIVNNAAILLGREKKIEELDLQEVEETFTINTFGPIRVVKHFLPLLKGGQCSILNISSEAGSIANCWGGDYSYAMSKAALNMFSQELSHALNERGIRVYSVHPGWIRTDMGGPDAPGDPEKTAASLYRMMTGEIMIDSAHVFVDTDGNAIAF